MQPGVQSAPVTGMGQGAVPKPAVQLTRELPSVLASLPAHALATISRDRLDRAARRRRGRRVAVIGDAMLDVYLRGDVERISPEAPVPVVRVRERQLRARRRRQRRAERRARIGARCDLVARRGRRRRGRSCATMLRDDRRRASRSLVTVARRRRPRRASSRASQQVVRVDEEEDADLDGDEVERAARRRDRAAVERRGRAGARGLQQGRARARA